MSTEKGNLSINSENILPIIKKWLYSDTDIFIRELVSNAADAITKLERLSAIGEADIKEDEAFAISVVLDKANKTIKIIDNGIGMTADEIKQYINQIAFSGATEFMEKYKDKMDAENEIIGHFGLGFYSSFMVSKVVQIDSLSYREGAKPAKWVCDGGIEFSLEPSEKATRGTEITLFINEESESFLDDYKLRSILKKYCAFIPVDIFYENVATPPKANEEGVVEPQVPINNKKPLWVKKPNDCTDEEYKAFYREVFHDFNEPLFWIHLNMDYPFRLKGILYFPKLKHELESIEGQVKLFNNQVFIADNIKEVIPEFLLLLKGVIDCPDLPLNVSRSFLQNDGYVSKMSSYITKKVADKLDSLFKEQRETYEKYWDDISPFIKYGCIKERDFYDKVKDILLYKTTNGTYQTLSAYLEQNEPKIGKKVLYATNASQQSQYILLLKEQDIGVVLLETKLDNAFISYMESYSEGVTFARVDADISDALKSEIATEETEEKTEEKKALSELFKRALHNNELVVQVETLKTANVPAVILLSEESRRMQEMSQMFGGMNMFGGGASSETLVLNLANPLVQNLQQMENNKDEQNQKDVQLLCEHIYDLAMLSHKPLSETAMAKFIARNHEMMQRIIK